MADWYKEWFASDFYLSVYSHRDDDDAELFLNNILQYLSIPKEGSVLDAACGSGRHSIIMADKGFNVTAFDLSEPLLEKGIEKAAQMNLNINFINSDIRSFYVNKKFDLILNLFTSFGYFLNDEENFAFVKSAYNMLNEGGYFLFDFFNEGFLKKNIVNVSEKEIDGYNISEKRSIRDDRIVKDIIIEKDGVSNYFEESVRLYSFSEIKEQFIRIGFNIEKIFGNYECGDFSINDSERLIIIFKK